MNKIFIFTIVFSMSLFSLHAQTDTCFQNTSPFSKGTKALLFQISNNFTLRSFEGGMISFKRHFSEKNALRIGVSFSGNHDEDENEQFIEPKDSMYIYNKNINSVVNASINTTFIKYINTHKVIKPYFGFGLFISFDHRFYSNDGNDPGMNTWTLGPLGVIGVEWFPNSNISLSGEYNCRGEIYFGEGYTSVRKVTSTILFKNRSKTFGYGFGQQSVRMGLSVYL